MSELVAGTAEQVAFLERLTDAFLLLPSGVHGVYGRGAQFESLRLAIDAFVTRSAIDDVVQVERMAFPPVIPRRQLEEIGYLASFPHLAGTIFSFMGDEREAAELAERAAAKADWSSSQTQTELVLVPAACYPSYPAVAARGDIAEIGVSLDLGGSYVFRHEPSSDPARMQMFHQREIVRIGEPEQVADWRERWRNRAVQMLRAIGLDAKLDVATDPFFGRSGRMLAASQREQELKFELLVQIAGPEPTAVASFNYHHDHFSAPYAINMVGGSIAHTACLGFGLERITLALIRTHGPEPTRWPDAARKALWSR